MRKFYFNSENISQNDYNCGHNILTLFRMHLLGAVHGGGGGRGRIFHTYPTMIKLGTVIPDLK